jgi:hypothetical protein
MAALSDVRPHKTPPRLSLMTHTMARFHIRGSWNDVDFDCDDYGYMTESARAVRSASDMQAEMHLRLAVNNTSSLLVIIFVF